MQYGSSLALYNALKTLNKNVDVIIPDYSKTYDFLPGMEEVKKEGKKYRNSQTNAYICRRHFPANMPDLLL